MTPQEFAALLNGRQYGKEITKAEEAQAKAAGLVVVYGYSDDNVELCGAIDDEIGMYDGGAFCITSDGTLMPSWESIECSDKDEAREYFRLEALPRKCVECDWAPLDEEGLSWRFRTDIPHATFDVMEDGEVFCRGIVFALSELRSHASSNAAGQDVKDQSSKPPSEKDMSTNTPSAGIKRFYRDCTSTKMIANSGGAWVRYLDHEAVVSALEHQLAEARSALRLAKIQMHACMLNAHAEKVCFDGDSFHEALTAVTAAMSPRDGNGEAA